MSVIRTEEHVQNFESWLVKAAAGEGGSRVEIEQLIEEGRQHLHGLREDYAQEMNAVTDISLCSKNIGRGMEPQWSAPGAEACYRVKGQVLQWMTKFEERLNR